MSGDQGPEPSRWIARTETGPGRPSRSTTQPSTHNEPSVSSQHVSTRARRAPDQRWPARDAAARRLQGDALVAQDFDAFGRRGHGDFLSRQCFKDVGVRMQRHGRLRRNRADRPLLREHARGAGRHGGVRLRGRHMRIGLRGGMQMLARVQHGAGRRGEIQRVGGVDQQVRAIDAFDVGLGRALAIDGLSRGLAIDLGRIAAVLFRVERLEEFVVARGRRQGARLMLAGAVVEPARGVLRAAQQQQGLLGIGLGRLALFARRRRHQHALA